METKPQIRCNHESNRYKVCAICAKKIVFGTNPLSKFIISEHMEGLIRKFSNKDFTLLDQRFPKVLCLSCRVTIYDRNKGKTLRVMPAMPNYLDIQLLAAVTKNVFATFAEWENKQFTKKLWSEEV